MPPPYEKRKRPLELSERLNALDEFRALPLVQERICLEHVNHPDYTKEEIAQKLGLSAADVYAFFHSHGWEVINQELAKQQLRELVQLSIQTLHECLKDKKGTIRLQAATTVLMNAHLIEKEPKSIRQDNKLVVLWNTPNDDKLGKLINGNNHSVLTAPETGGSTRLEGQI